MVDLYKDPKGETIFTKTSTQAPTLGVNTDNQDECDNTLKRRIKELEDEVKQKEVLFNPMNQ